MKVKLLTLLLAVGMCLCLQAQEASYPDYQMQGTVKMPGIPTTGDNHSNTLWWIIGTLASVVGSLFGLVIWQNNRLLSEKDRSYEREKQRNQEERSIDQSQYAILKELQQKDIALSEQTLEIVKELRKN